MKKFYVLIISLIIFKTNASTQAYHLLFEKSFTIDNAIVSEVQSKIDAEGNTYIMGTVHTNGFSTHMFIWKVNSNGNKVWTRIINNNGDSSDIADAMTIDSAGNVYITGRRITGSQTCSGDICTTYTFSYIITYKYSASGNQLWVNRFGNRLDQLHPIDIKLSTNGKMFVIANSTPGFFQEETPPYTNNLIIETINNKGITIQSRKKLNMVADAACLDNEGNLLIAGAFPQSGAGYYGNYYGALIKFTNNLIHVWDTSFADKKRSCELLYVACDSLNNIYVHGSTDTFYIYRELPINPGVVTIKYNSSGTERWVVHNKSGSRAFTADNNGRTFFATSMYTGVFSSSVKKYNSSGKMIWTSNIDSSDVFNIAKQNGIVYVLARPSQDHLNIITINSLGRQTGSYKTHYVASESFQLDALNNIYVSGTDIFGDTIFLSKYTQHFAATLIPVESPQINISMYPNPVNNILNVVFTSTSTSKNKSYKCFIYDINGNLLKAADVNNNNGNYSAQINTGNLHNGTYTLKISDGVNIISKTFIKQ